jgi:hypothetical protein
MDRDRLFLETISDLERRTRSTDEYDYLIAAGLIRKLLIDGDPLALQVNRDRRMKLRFEVVDSDVTLPPGLPVPAFHAPMDGLSPRINADIPKKQPTKIVTLDEFLRTIALRVEAEPFTVREVVRQVAHIEGGVHAGSPQADREKILVDVNSTVGPSGLISRAMRGIGYVVVDSLQDLENAIRGSRP